MRRPIYKVTKFEATFFKVTYFRNDHFFEMTNFELTYFRSAQFRRLITFDVIDFEVKCLFFETDIFYLFFIIMKLNYINNLT